MFGEGFFMGLEILYKLPENIRNRKDVQCVLKRSEEEITDWNSITMLKNIRKAVGVIQSTNHHENIVTKKLILWLQDMSSEKFLLDISLDLTHI